MEYEKLAKSHVMLLSVMELYQFCPKMYQVCVIFGATKKLSIDVESLHFRTFSTKRRECKIMKRDGHEKLTNGHGKVMKKS